ncbi:MAG: 2-hydroxyglutaryl-CoA dehydratase, partial [Clostridia bacterium]|nr:2-hydroxyglutaryl-CoA dehydratase [Clostridia bacterium]
MRIGLDIGSTTVKTVLLGSDGSVLFARYRRHGTRAAEQAGQLLAEMLESYPQLENVPLAITGSAGMGLAEKLGVPFIQEVHATRICCEKRFAISTGKRPDVVIELGGEDSKIIFLDNAGSDARMNGSCAGGTGAFIDQMAALLGVASDELDAMAERAERTYTIASRCGVFA